MADCLSPGAHYVSEPHVGWSWADGPAPGLVGGFVPRVLLCALGGDRGGTGTLRAPGSPLTPIGTPEPFCRPAGKTTAQRSTGSHAGR